MSCDNTLPILICDKNVASSDMEHLSVEFACFPLCLSGFSHPRVKNHACLLSQLDFYDTIEVQSGEDNKWMVG